MKRSIILLTVFAVLAVFAGCGMSYQTKENTIFVQRDGTIAETNVMSLSGVGSAEELESFIDEEIASYEGDGTVTKDSFEVEGDEASLTMIYSNSQTYSDFIKKPFFASSVIKAQAAGYPFDVAFYAAEGSGAEADGTEVQGDPGAIVSRDVVLDNPNYYVVILGLDTSVRVDGKILYYSANVTPVDNSTAQVTGYEDESLMPPPAYIVFR